MNIATQRPTVEVTGSNIDTLLASETPVLLDFWASWCVPCMLMKRTIEKAALALDSRVTVGLVNIDEQPEIVERFSVRGTPTFLVVNHGRPVGAFTGMASSSTIVRQVESALAPGSAR